MIRDKWCGELRESDIGSTLSVAGWVFRRRDHGGLIFVDLRDRKGLIQVVFSPDVSPESHQSAHELRGEYVISVSGEVRRRPAGTENATLSTGMIELYAHKLIILNEATPLPFPMEEAEDASEALRLKYRYLDLRRPQLQHNLLVRHKVAKVTRDYLDERGFLEIETPMLTKSTPEGARDYLVPSRLHDGHFYALPQSPQLFKQILMVAGFDRYYQIVKCFRDEDLRADRQPEFTQIDIETSFLSEHEIQDLMEGLVRHMFQQALGVELGAFPRISYAEAMAKYGSDKPDLRVNLEFTELTDLMQTVEFKVFKHAAGLKDGRVAALCIPGGATLTRKEIDDYTAFVAIYGAKGLAYIKVNDAAKPNADGLQSPIVKFLTPEVLSEIVARSGAQSGDLIFFCADRDKIVADALGALRSKIGHERGLALPGWRPLWVVDFPMFEFNEETKTWGARHHPFTASKDGHEALFESDPGHALAKAYDVVLN